MSCALKPVKHVACSYLQYMTCVNTCPMTKY